MPAAPTEEQESLRLGPGQLAWRAAVFVVVVLLLVQGSVRGVDDHWPFGPMSQFAFRTDPNGEIRAVHAVARTAAGDSFPVPLTFEQIGLNRAQIEGQLTRFRAEPVRLEALADSHARLHPGEPAWVQVDLFENVTRLRNGRAGTAHDELVARWQAP